jgi:TatD DNase family protein
MIIDTHCHYNFEPIYSNLEQEWQNSLDHKVIGGICVGTNLKSSILALHLAKKYPTMFASVGIHPEECEEIFLSEDSTNQIHNLINEFEKLVETTYLDSGNKLVAIGEIGLDYFRLKAKGLKREQIEKLQKELFSTQLNIAFKHQLPVILHIRDQNDRLEKNAYYDLLTMVSDLINQYQKDNKEIPNLVLHCASGPQDYIKSFLNLGAYIGFAGNITYQNADELKNILKLTPKDRMLLETDAPFLAPNEKKGQSCHPYYIAETAQYLQDQFNLDLDIILENTLRVFQPFQKVIQK